MGEVTSCWAAGTLRLAAPDGKQTPFEKVPTAGQAGQPPSDPIKRKPTGNALATAAPTEGSDADRHEHDLHRGGGEHRVPGHRAPARGLTPPQSVAACDQPVHFAPPGGRREGKAAARVAGQLERGRDPAVGPGPLARRWEHRELRALHLQGPAVRLLLCAVPRHDRRHVLRGEHPEARLEERLRRSGRGAVLREVRP
eukprot:CAMPEP_0174357290 /NCGR_PEP_ID=MMETSP0811_2-20130205/35127_1 /TAXON_ID=73025 ORGANISM="Eutreptiella gymnastica-like, Strain CCMP1594" /NCGR_SAMPLE_ID=MMETSP0811_2 /ASSEMBLY_ACC=CAM_ASM_000667 /LENGTH=197 /DNA_ID=CAMNT_0015489971 /DNA_START=1766 /DNA_END=2356 /DNA_ORIENTATION=+